MLRRFLLLLLLQVVYFTAQRSILFVDAKNESVLRGSNAKNQPLDGLPHRELPDASATQTKLVLKDITDNEKEKENDKAIEDDILKKFDTVRFLLFTCVIRGQLYKGLN